MKITSRFAKMAGVISLAAIVAAGLSACGAVSGNVNQAYLVTKNVDSINCSTVDNRADTVKSLQATADFVNNASGKQTTDILALNKGTTSLKPLQAALSTKIKACSQTAKPAVQTASESGSVGVLDGKNTVTKMPLIGGTDSVMVLDSTAQTATPPLLQPKLLDGSLRFTAQTLSWQGLVERVGQQQWYKDGVNSYAAQTGFTWDDVLKFAAANKVVNDKVQGVNALAIQAYNVPSLTDAQVRDQVRSYITPSIEKVIGITVDDLPIQRINNGFVNTRNVGTANDPKMGTYFDTEKMIRVSLMPIKFDAAGKPVGLDGSRGAGIFIDCGNLHWVPQAMFKCTDTSCTMPKCPEGTVGMPPNCSIPPPKTPPTCEQLNGGLECKGDSINNGWTPLGAGPLTTHNVTEQQRQAGQVSGNVTDHTVPSDTKSGSTTSDMGSSNGQTGSSGVTAPGATPGGDSQSTGTPTSAPTDPTGSSNTGGTSGQTCVKTPTTPTCP